jgi:hypothetical protein
MPVGGVRPGEDPASSSGRTGSDFVGIAPDPHWLSAIHGSARMPGMKQYSPAWWSRTAAALHPPAERFPRDGEGAGAVVGPEQRVLLGAEPDEVAVVDPDPLEESNWRAMLAPMIRKTARQGCGVAASPAGAGWDRGPSRVGLGALWCGPFAGQSRSVVGPARRNGRIGLSRVCVHVVRVPADQGVHLGASLADRGRYGRRGRRSADQSSRLARVTLHGPVPDRPFPRLGCVTVAK